MQVQLRLAPQLRTALLQGLVARQQELEAHFALQVEDGQGAHTPLAAQVSLVGELADLLETCERSFRARPSPFSKTL